MRELNSGICLMHFDGSVSAMSAKKRPTYRWHACRIFVIA
jgi:hypothetical protein